MLGVVRTVLSSRCRRHGCHLPKGHVHEIEASDHNDEAPQQASSAAISQGRDYGSQKDFPSRDKTAREPEDA